jgi:hypothetical protein
MCLWSSSGILEASNWRERPHKRIPDSCPDALEHAQTVEKQVRENITLEYTYEQTNAVMKAVRDLQAEIIDQSFTGGPLPCRIVVAILPPGQKPSHPYWTPPENRNSAYMKSLISNQRLQ